MTDEHAVIASYRITGNDFGEPGERRRLRAVEQRLSEVLGATGAGEFDGDEFGEGTVTLYMYGPDASALYAAVEPVLRSFPARPAQVLIRYGESTDPSAREVLVSL